MSGVIKKVITATKIPVAASPTPSSASNELNGVGSAAAPLMTETVVPIPVSPIQSEQSPDSAPFPSSNGSSIYGNSASEATSTTSANLGTGSSVASSPQSNYVPFTGAADRKMGGMLSAVLIAIGAVLIAWPRLCDGVERYIERCQSTCLPGMALVREDLLRSIGWKSISILKLKFTDWLHQGRCSLLCWAVLQVNGL